MPQVPRVYSSPAIVLRQRKLGDADKLLTLYTANLGANYRVNYGYKELSAWERFALNMSSDTLARWSGVALPQGSQDHRPILTQQPGGGQGIPS